MSLDALFAVAQSGDARARRALADAIYASLHRFFRRRLGNSGLDADDLVQATFEVLLHRMDGFVPDHPRAFTYLVKRTARNVLFTTRRSMAREAAHEAARRIFKTPVAIARDTSPSARVTRSEELELLAEVIAELDSVDQRTLRDRMASAGWDEQVEREGVARSTLRIRFRRALVRIRERLERANSALFPRLREPSTN